MRPCARPSSSSELEEPAAYESMAIAIPPRPPPTINVRCICMGDGDEHQYP